MMSLRKPWGVVWRPPDQMPPSTSIAIILSGMAKSKRNLRSGLKRYSRTKEMPALFRSAANTSSYHDLFMFIPPPLDSFDQEVSSYFVKLFQ